MDRQVLGCTYVCDLGSDIVEATAEHNENYGDHFPLHDEIMVFIIKAISEDSGEPAHPRSLARAFAVRTHEYGSRQRVPPKKSDI